MKMKKACEATALTERAIRLYLSKGLIKPRQSGGLIDFSSEDIQLLKNIALLRRFDFSIEQISGMIQCPAMITDILQQRIDHAQENIEHEKDVFAVLKEIGRGNLDSLSALAEKIREHCTNLPEPDFGRFDELSDERRQMESDAAFLQIEHQEKRRRLLGRLIKPCCIIAALVIVASLYLSQLRVRGYIPVSPFTIVELYPENILDSQAITIDITNEWALDVIGKSTITVPYHAHGVPLAVGDQINEGCQLAIELTNYDLFRIGINPFQTIRTRNVEINNEWMKMIVRALFDSDLQKKTALWIREYNPDNLRPLF